MKKVHSKSTISKKNKTIDSVPESKKNSRIYRASSSVKISSRVTQNLLSNLNLHPTLSKSNLQNISQKAIIPISQSKNNQLNDKKQSQRGSAHNHNTKTSTQTIPARQTLDQIFQLRKNNQQLAKENSDLKKKSYDLQQQSVRDKQKIKNLIIRINQVKNQKQITSQSKGLHPQRSKLIACVETGTASYSFLPQRQKQTPYKMISQGPCQRPECIQRKKYLQSELYQQRLQRDKLQKQRREWQKNRQVLKQQYKQLLDQIKGIRQNQT